MVTLTENGSGGSRIGVQTGFEGSGGADDFDLQAAEIRKKVNAIRVAEMTLKGEAPSPIVFWLGLQTLKPSLGLHRPSEAAAFQAPPLELSEATSQYN